MIDTLGIKITQRSLNRAIEGIKPPSSIIRRLLSILQLDDPQTFEIESCVAEDPKLAIEVLRCANTADSGAHLRIDSIVDAVSFLGHARLCRIGLQYSFAELASKDLLSYGRSADYFYRKSVVCAIAMDYLLNERTTKGSNAYTIGLLHAVGELVIDEHLRRFGLEESVFRGASLRPLSLKEDTLLGVNQAKLAGDLLRGWGFDEAIVKPIEGQFDLSVESKYKDRTTALATSRYVTELFMVEESGGPKSTERTAHMVFKGKSLCRLIEFIKEELSSVGLVA